ncbi:pectate lyase [Sorangium cellulosum]|uniref:Pectate lyase n=2 Tax=Sorangium cellulosum TaxID=56 RepID=A0A150P1B1_SORCE|nr:pectate lyase [Sorangium cellulosum]KYF48427.1 pectate lyase [Sorangium cellulosum]
MKRRTFAMSMLLPVVLAACGEDSDPEPGPGPGPGPGPEVPPEMVPYYEAMKRAATFMSEKVAYKGGYVWSYLPDLSQSWGEMEAFRTMLWVQPPGTPSMGHAYLDAYHATGDELFYKAAEQVALALVEAQHEAGGWNYIYDFAGEESLKEWYDTIGQNGWRLEEFHHYYGNATFDDAGTAVASQLLLRMYLEKKDERFRGPLEKAIGFVTTAQYPGGGWPQRFPLMSKEEGVPDYTSLVTFNDDVAGENIKFLIMCRMALGQPELLDNIERAMDNFVAMQQPAPQPAWGLQFTLEGEPVGARTYEPTALTTHTTANNIQQLLNFYELTGDERYIARVPEALDWLDKVKLTPELIELFPDRTHPTYIEIGTDVPLYVHRRGSNVVNGEYYFDKDPEKPIGHYGQARKLDVAAMRERYDALKAKSPEELTAGSPLKTDEPAELPKYFSLREVSLSDLYVGRTMATTPVTEADAQKVVSELNEEGYWPVKLTYITNPPIGPGTAEPYLEDTYATTHVGDLNDTSPYEPSKAPAGYPPKEAPTGITVESFIKNMGTLIAYVAPVQ